MKIAEILFDHAMYFNTDPYTPTLQWDSETFDRNLFLVEGPSPDHHPRFRANVTTIIFMDIFM